MFMRSDFLPEGKGVQPTPTLFRQANIGKRYWTADLNLISDDEPHKEKVLAYKAVLPKAVSDEGQSLLLHGEHGSGKTAIACCLLRETMSRSANRVYFALIHDLDTYSRIFPTDDLTPWDLVMDAPLVTIDDVGAQVVTDRNEAIFERVVRHRYHENLPTIITANLPLADLVAQRPWLNSIISEVFDVIEVKGSWR